MKRFGILFFFFCITTFCPAQDTTYARYIIEKLCSKKFAGRGYVNNGDKIASQFLAAQFDSLGAEKLSESYFQNFTLPVNTFPSKMEVAVNKVNLTPGRDFIVHPASASAKGKYKATILKNYNGVEDLRQASKKCYLICKDSIPETDFKKLQSDLYNQTITHGAFIFEEKKKLTWSVSTSDFAVPVVTLIQQFLPKEGEEVSFKISAVFKKQHHTQNVISCIKAKAPTDSFVVFTAHYDHLGKMGRHAYFPGANDNASGTSMLLNLASYYAKNKSEIKYNVLFIAFAAEEAGLIGSEFYTSNPLFPLNKIKMLINMDLMGTGDDGMMVVNATEFKPQFELLQRINNKANYLVKLGERGKAKNSDHYYFSEKGVPSFFFYTMGGIAAYHDIYDIAATLPLTDYSDVFKLITEFVEEL